MHFFSPPVGKWNQRLPGGISKNMESQSTTPNAERKKMGRPLGFNRAEALRAAMLLFWRHGFEGTSYADLTAATGMSKPTLYATFGDKVSLFHEAVVAYGQKSTEEYEEVLKLSTAREVVEACLRLAVGSTRQSEEPIVCFLVQGALTGSADTQALRDQLLFLRRENARQMLTRLDRAKQEGELPPSVDTAVLTEYIATLAVGIAVQAASGSTPESLQQAITLAMTNWPGR